MAVLPEMMRAIDMDAPGDASVLTVREKPVPQPGAGEVLIRVSAAGVNRPDIVQRMGLYPPPPGAPSTPGLEVAGEIVAIGEGVNDALLGQNMCALVGGGGYADYCIAKHDHCLPIPASLTMEEAAALPETLFTVWHNVFERAYARDGETMLVHGGTSGIGTMAIMLGKMFEMTVYVTCGSDEKCAKAEELGAAAAINYKTTDFVAEIDRLTDGKGVHIVLDMVAGDYVPRNMACLAEGGRHVTIAVQGGLKANISMVDIMRKRLTLTGSTLRPRTDAFKGLLADEIARNVMPLVAERAVVPIIDSRFPLEDAGKAQTYMESGAHFGKIVLLTGQ
ncbi:NAD(P)H-quinone oxidoreductase [Alterisphingorhabdus coralli]|uniref:NAD(P)H-quinone oxidoreductase n=1 Tax=Alterisphingorhabdus coralli TaxID=3071408 RepID=A0AA97F8I0_9SPHN|nr:NAD(P)H-quinone oxidoreductase [Parasphingorhabdus sp. SCSIO 66989]WOE75232.1 NAD(P)H-quinone oxidoreductase [Parasphingorhabdus sp. SCSIO 66989]